MKNKLGKSILASTVLMSGVIPVMAVSADEVVKEELKYSFNDGVFKVSGKYKAGDYYVSLATPVDKNGNILKFNESYESKDGNVDFSIKRNKEALEIYTIQYKENENSDVEILGYIIPNKEGSGYTKTSSPLYFNTYMTEYYSDLSIDNFNKLPLENKLFIANNNGESRFGLFITKDNIEYRNIKAVVSNVEGEDFVNFITDVKNVKFDTLMLGSYLDSEGSIKLSFSSGSPSGTNGLSLDKSGKNLNIYVITYTVNGVYHEEYIQIKKDGSFIYLSEKEATIKIYSQIKNIPNNFYDKLILSGKLDETGREYYEEIVNNAKSIVIHNVDGSIIDLNNSLDKDEIDYGLVVNGYLPNWDAKVLIEMLPEGSVDNKKFPDIKGTTHENEIRFLTANNIINGYTDGKFKPNNVLSRSDVIKMTSRLFKIPVVKKIENETLAKELGVGKDLELYSYVPVVSEIFGVGNYKKTVNRGELSVYMEKVLESFIKEKLGLTTFNSREYLEIIGFEGKVSGGEYKESVKVLEYFGLTRVSGDFKVSDKLTRGQLSSFLTRLYSVDTEGIVANLDEMTEKDLRDVIGEDSVVKNKSLTLNKLSEFSNHSNNSDVIYSISSEGLANQKVFITFNENLLNSATAITKDATVGGDGTHFAHITSTVGAESTYETLKDNTTPKELVLKIEDDYSTESYVAVIELDNNGKGSFTVSGQNTNITPVVFFEEFEEDAGSMYEYHRGDGILDKKTEIHNVGETIKFS